MNNNSIDNSEILNSFSPRDNFWKINGEEFKIPKAFSDIYMLDKGKGKSSSIMWMVALYADYSSKFFRLPHEDKIKLLCIDFMSDPDFYKNNRKLFDDAVYQYEMMQNNPLKKELSDWAKGMEIRNSTIRELEEMIKTGYEVIEDEEEGTIKRRLDPKERLELMEKIDKFRANTPKLYQEYKRINEELVKDGNNVSIKGNRNPSLLEMQEDIDENNNN